MRRPLLYFLILLLPLLVSAACEPLNSGFEPQISAPQTACTSGQAQIEIGDGYQRILCGCAEPAGAMVPSAGSKDPALTCTVPSGTVVFFEYLSTVDRHQIISLASPSFPSSPISDPSDHPPLQIYGATFSPAGTYLYEDAFEPGTTGQIVAQ